jgi:hypothetical protein
LEAPVAALEAAPQAFLARPGFPQTQQVVAVAEAASTQLLRKTAAVAVSTFLMQVITPQLAALRLEALAWAEALQGLQHFLP